MTTFPKLKGGYFPARHAPLPVIDTATLVSIWLDPKTPPWVRERGQMNGAMVYPSGHRVPFTHMAMKWQTRLLRSSTARAWLERSRSGYRLPVIDADARAHALYLASTTAIPDPCALTFGRILSAWGSPALMF